MKTLSTCISLFVFFIFFQPSFIFAESDPTDPSKVHRPCGFPDNMNCFENGEIADAPVINANFKYLVDKLKTLQDEIAAFEIKVSDISMKGYVDHFIPSNSTIKNLIEKSNSLQNEVNSIKNTLSTVATRAYVDQSIPSGSVMAFDLNSCPAGWSLFSGLQGRTIVGAGQGSGLTNRIKGHSGGEENHTLTTNEMPSHNHLVSYESPENFNSKDNGSDNDWGFNRGHTTRTASSSYSGGNRPHNNMQPFYVLLYCRKN